jgi:hypothetical protein
MACVITRLQPRGLDHHNHQLNIIITNSNFICVTSDERAKGTRARTVHLAPVIECYYVFQYPLHIPPRSNENKIHTQSPLYVPEP